MDRCERPAWGNVTGPASAVAAGAFVASEKLCRFDSCHSKILSNLRFCHETFCAVSFFRFRFLDRRNIVGLHPGTAAGPTMAGNFPIIAGEKIGMSSVLLTGIPFSIVSTRWCGWLIIYRF